MGLPQKESPQYILLLQQQYLLSFSSFFQSTLLKSASFLLITVNTLIISDRDTQKQGSCNNHEDLLLANNQYDAHQVVEADQGSSLSAQHDGEDPKALHYCQYKAGREEVRGAQGALPQLRERLCYHFRDKNTRLNFVNLGCAKLDKL